MVADLTECELQLRPGFEQATVLGLTALCGEALGGESLSERGERIVCAPRREQLIHRYYPLWLENRNRANQTV